jgi:hypothetical protein
MYSASDKSRGIGGAWSTDGHPCRPSEGRVVGSGIITSQSFVSLPQQHRKVEGVTNKLKVSGAAKREADILIIHAVAEKEVDTLGVYGPATYALRRVPSSRV